MRFIIFLPQTLVCALISAGVGHQSLTNVHDGGKRQNLTLANIGAGLKYYFANNFYAKASLDGQYGMEKRDDGHQANGWQAWAWVLASVAALPLSPPQRCA